MPGGTKVTIPITHPIGNSSEWNSVSSALLNSEARPKNIIFNENLLKGCTKEKIFLCITCTNTNYRETRLYGKAHW